jgi:hypothetical protein
MKTTKSLMKETMPTLRSMIKDLEMKGFYKDWKADLVEKLLVSYREFRKIIVGLRPAMLAYMKFTLLPDYTDLSDVDCGAATFINRKSDHEFL